MAEQLDAAAVARRRRGEVALADLEDGEVDGRIDAEWAAPVASNLGAAGGQEEVPRRASARATAVALGLGEAARCVCWSKFYSFYIEKNFTI